MKLRRLRRRWVAGAIVVALAAGGVTAYAFDHRVHAGGPLDVVVQDSVGGPARPGELTATAAHIVFNRGGEPAVVTSIRPLLKTPGLNVEAVAVQTKPRTLDFFCCAIGWPLAPGDRDLADPKDMRRLPVTSSPDEDLSAVNAGVNVVWLLRADRPGRYGFRATELRYRVGRKRYRRVLGAAVMVCVSASRTDECPLMDMPNDAELAAL